MTAIGEGAAELLPHEVKKTIQITARLSLPTPREILLSKVFLPLSNPQIFKRNRIVSIRDLTGVT
jgi:hypothetical protein